MAALVVVAMMSGCSTYAGSKTTATVGAITAVVGLVSGVALLTGNDPGTGLLGLLVVTTIAVPGAVVGIAGFVGMGAPEGLAASDRRATTLLSRTRPMRPEERTVCMEQRRSQLRKAQELTNARARGEAILRVSACDVVVVPVEPETDPQAQAAAAHARAEAARERAWGLTKEAAAAAHGGDCTKVVNVGSQVLALDAEFHATVFLRDVAIKRCLDADAPAPVTTPAPTSTPPGPTP